MVTRQIVLISEAVPSPTLDIDGEVNTILALQSEVTIEEV